MNTQSSRLAALAKIASNVNSKYGAGSMRLSQVVQKRPRLSTGSLLFDAGLGGGIPVGRISLLWGKKSSGKTWTAMSVAAYAQNLCANCLRWVEITDVVETSYTDDDDETHVAWVAQGQCDCFASGVFKPKPYAYERNDKASDGLQSVEMPVLDDDGEPVIGRGGKPKTRRVNAFDMRLAAYQENSYEEYRVGLFDAEVAFDSEWCEKIGVDTRRLVVHRPESGEEVVDTYDALVRSGAVDLLICDSIAAMTPRREIEHSAEDDHVALQARMMARMCRKTVSAMTATWKDFGREVTQIWINQLRVNIGVSFGPSEILPAGKAQEFVNAVEVRMWASKGEDEIIHEGLSQKDQMSMATRVRLNFKTEKNKTAPPKQIGSFVLDTRTGQVVQGAQMLSLGERYNLLKREKTKWIWSGTEFATKMALEAYLADAFHEGGVRDQLLACMLESR